MWYSKINKTALFIFPGMIKRHTAAWLSDTIGWEEGDSGIVNRARRVEVRAGGFKIALQGKGVWFTVFVGCSLYFSLFLKLFQGGCFHFFKGFFLFFFKKSVCLLVHAQLMPVSAYTHGPGFPYGFHTQSLMACLPSSFETKACKIYGEPFCFLF